MTTYSLLHCSFCWVKNDEQYLFMCLNFEFTYMYYVRKDSHADLSYSSTKAGHLSSWHCWCTNGQIFAGKTVCFVLNLLLGEMLDIHKQAQTRPSLPTPPGLFRVMNGVNRPNGAHLISPITFLSYFDCHYRMLRSIRPIYFSVFAQNVQK